MDYQALKDEINNDPENMGYSNHLPQNHVKVASLLSQDDPSGDVVYESISSSEALRIAGGNDTRADLENAKDSGKKSIRAIAHSALDVMKSGQSFDLGNQKTRGMLQKLVDEGVLTSTQQQDFLDLSGRTKRREEVVLGIGTNVTHQDVTKALNS